jgi:hypothetical protein
MEHLNTQPNFHDPDRASFASYGPGDDFYELLVAAQRDLNEAQSHALFVRLSLLLSNHIGDLRVLREAIAAARSGVEK